MSPKVNVSSRIKKEIYDKIMDMGVSPTAIIADFLELYANEMDRDAHLLLKMATIKEVINRLNVEIQDLEVKKGIRDELTNKFNITVEEYNMSRDDVLASELMLKLDRIIILYNYNEEKILEKYSKLINEIKHLNKEFVLSERIERVKKIHQK
ncbi:MAG: hypothetical protein WC877_01615 [Dehalococcoidales bacterium]|jgi:hypothetical protein